MKKQHYILLLLCFLLTIKTFSQSQDLKYYYAYNEKIYLDEVKDKFIISYRTHDFSAVNTTLLSHFSTGEKIIWQNDSICLVEINEKKYELLKQSFQLHRKIKSLQPLYITADGLEMGITDEIVIKFNKNASKKQINDLHKIYDVTVKKTTDLYQILSVPSNLNPLEVANAYQLSGLVEFSHPNFIAKAEPHQIPNDPYFVNQFYLHNTGQTMPNGHLGTSGADINAPEAWDITKGSSNIIVAVIDEGVTANHPDLPNTRQVRLAGSNFAGGNSNDPSPSGNDNHGNSCAGVIAASHNNEGIAGIAPNCKIMPVRIPFGTVSATIYADAITFAKDNGADVLSNSWGYGSNNPNLYPVIRNAIEDATITGRNGKGCVVVFSAGNTANHTAGSNGTVNFPSNVEVAGVITVGASDRYDQQANYSPTSNISSSSNQVIDIVAPSHRAYSCQISTETLEAWTIDIPANAGYNPVKEYDCYSGGVLPVVGSSMPNSGTNNLAYTGHFGGTSCACPEVSAVAALILSINPNLTQQEVANIIESTARKAGSYTYQTISGMVNGTWNTQMGHGVLNAYAAVNLASLKISGASSLYSFQQGTYTISNLPTGATVTWSGSSNVNIISGQGTSQVTISICGGDDATLTATLTGSLNRTLNKNISVNNGELAITLNGEYVQVNFDYPNAQCYDWIISSDIYSDIGNGNINCTNNSSLTVIPLNGVKTETIEVRAKVSNCYSPWQSGIVVFWKPEINGACSYLNPSSGEPFYACLVEPFPETGKLGEVSYRWYVGSTFIGETYDTYVYSHEWPCGMSNVGVVVCIDNQETEMSANAEFWGMCTGGGGWGVSYSAAYPNPAGNELIIDRIEESSAETAALSAQSARGKTSEIRVLLYSNSTAQLVYNKTYSSSEKQIKIDTSKLPNGIYHLNIIENGEKIKEQTIVVNH
jgi:subtilisin family serine protease